MLHARNHAAMIMMKVSILCARQRHMDHGIDAIRTHVTWEKSTDSVTASAKAAKGVVGL